MTSIPVFLLDISGSSDLCTKFRNRTLKLDWTLVGTDGVAPSGYYASFDSSKKCEYRGVPPARRAGSYGDTKPIPLRIHDVPVLEANPKVPICARFYQELMEFRKAYGYVWVYVYHRTVSDDRLCGLVECDMFKLPNWERIEDPGTVEQKGDAETSTAPAPKSGATQGIPEAREIAQAARVGVVRPVEDSTAGFIRSVDVVREGLEELLKPQDVTHLQTENDRLKRRVFFLEEQLGSTIKAAENTRKALETERNELHAKACHLENELRESNACLKTCRESLAAVRIDRDSRIAELRTEKENHKSTCGALETNRVKTRELGELVENARCEFGLDESGSIFVTLSEILDSYRCIARERDQLKASFDIETARGRNTIGRLETKLREASNTIGNLNGELSRTKDALIKAENDLKIASTDMKVLVANLHDRADERDKARAEVELTKKQMNEAFTTSGVLKLIDERNAFQAEVESLKHQLEHEKVDHAACLSTNHALLSQVESTRTKLREVMTENESLKQERKVRAAADVIEYQLRQQLEAEKKRREDFQRMFEARDRAAKDLSNKLALYERARAVGYLAVGPLQPGDQREKVLASALGHHINENARLKKDLKRVRDAATKYHKGLTGVSAVLREALKDSMGQPIVIPSPVYPMGSTMVEFLAKRFSTSISAARAIVEDALSKPTTATNEQ